MTRTIARIRADGLVPRIAILTHSLPSEEAAFQVERAVIDALGLDNLENQVRGWRSRLNGRALLQDLIARYTPRRVRIREPVMLIRLTRRFRSDMSPVELYDITRSAWKLGSRRTRARYAFAVYEGVVREVYEITSWHQAGSTFNTTYDGRRVRRTGRYEFVGALAPDSIGRRYISSHVAHYFRQGAMNPITHVNCSR